MKFRGSLIAFGVLALATSAAAQTKISGTQQCKAEPPAAVAIGDRPNHAFAIIKAQCTWTKPIEIAGIQTKEGSDTIVSEISGDSGADHGYYIGTMSNGDKMFVRFSGTSHSKDGKPTGGEGTWAFTGGTGKLKGLKGKGTFKGTTGADGVMTTEIEGESSLP